MCLYIKLEGTHHRSPSYVRVRAVASECGKGQTDTQTAVANIHFASAMPHAKCNNMRPMALLPMTLSDYVNHYGARNPCLSPIAISPAGTDSD